MSDQPSAESEASTSALSGQVCASCGRPKLTSGADVCCDGIGRTQQSMTMFAPSTEKPNPSTFSAADFPAKTSALPASEQASRVSAPVSSLSSQGSQMSFGQDGLSLKTWLGSSPLPRAETLESFSQRGPKSGMASVGGWLTLDSLEFPSGAVECLLSDVLEMTVGERYALSARAARGILRRASVRGRALPPPLAGSVGGVGGVITTGVAYTLDRAAGQGVLANALDRGQGGPDDNSAQANHIVPDGPSVRRLTPTECERLMGWPDGWTAVDGDKTPDGRRYAACGNGVVANVSEWIGRRIMAIKGES